MLERLKVFIDKRLPFIGWTYRNIRDNRKFYQEPQNTSLGFKFNGNNAILSSHNFIFYDPELGL